VTVSRAGVAPAAVVFDCDGLLLDTAPLWEAAERRVVVARGGVWDRGSRAAVHGLSMSGAAAILAKHVKSPAPVAQLVAELVDAFRIETVRRGVDPMPGATGLLRDLQGWRPLAVASNMPEPLLHWVLAQAGLAAAFVVAVGSSVRRRPKPAPDIYRDACAELGFSPRICHALEDSQPGVDAGVAAGLPVTGVSSSTSLARCIQVASLAELSPDWFLTGRSVEVG
jgi:HAD superfamily hydrolase (TIGR01509 family)